MDEFGDMMTNNIVIIIAKKIRYASVNKGKVTPMVEHIDDIGRVVDDKVVALF